MRLIAWISLGIVVWSSTLVWPDISLVMIPAILVGLLLILETMVLLSSLEGHFVRRSLPIRPVRSDQATRPVSVSSMR